MDTQIKDEFMILQCGECGCRRLFKDKEVPVGECRFCKTDFGYYILPDELYQKAFNTPEGKVPFSWQAGDIIVLNPRIKPLDSRRIAIVIREGKEIYRDRNYVG